MAFPANTALLKQSFQMMNSLREKLKDRSDERNDSDYEGLRQSALNVQDLRERVRSLDAEGRRALLAAGPVAQSARLRVANAREDLDGNFSDWMLRASKAADESSTKMGKAVKKFRRNPKKTSKRVAKRAEKAAQKVTDKMTGKAARRAERRKKLRTGGIVAGVIALLAAGGGVVYYVITNRRQSPVLDTPPRVEEHSGKRQSELVYSTTTEEAMTEDATARTPKPVDNVPVDHTPVDNASADTPVDEAADRSKITYPTADAPETGDQTSTDVPSAEQHSAAEEAVKQASGERVGDGNVYDHAGESAAQPADADADAEEKEDTREEMEKHKKNM